VNFPIRPVQTKSIRGKEEGTNDDQIESTRFGWVCEKNPFFYSASTSRLGRKNSFVIKGYLN